MATYSHPITLPASPGVVRPARRADAVVCPWAPPDPATRIDIGWQPGPTTSAGAVWPPPLATTRVHLAPPLVTAIVSTPPPPPPPAYLIADPAPPHAARVGAEPARPGRRSRRHRWTIALAAGAASIVATIAALLASL